MVFASKTFQPRFAAREGFFFGCESFSDMLKEKSPSGMAAIGTTVES
jgi:hypothetical protein